MILAIDPGTTHSAYVVLQNGKILAKAKLCNFQLRSFLAGLSGFVPTLAIEGMQSYGMPSGREIFDTCHWIGRFVEVGVQHPTEVWPVFRPQVLAHHVGILHKGGDAKIHRAMLKRFGKAACKGVTYDVWSALAIAAYVADKQKEGRTAPKWPPSMIPRRLELPPCTT